MAELNKSEDLKAATTKWNMMQNISEEHKKEKEVYEFLNDDDDFEEFEVGDDGMLDNDMNGGDVDKQLW